MRQNGDDDYGLPHVDVVVPDDARELDADVALWRREQRGRLRRERIKRVFGPVTRYGLAAPLITGFLLIALISGTLMTVFGPRAAPPMQASLPADRPTAAAGEVGGLLPAVPVVIDGRQAPADQIRRGVIVMVPPGCRCEAMIQQLARQVLNRSFDLHLLADRRDGQSVAAAHRELIKIASKLHAIRPKIMDDSQNKLVTAYDAKGLTIVVVKAGGTVHEIFRDRTSVVPDLKLEMLAVG